MPSLPASTWKTFAQALFRKAGVPDDERKAILGGTLGKVLGLKVPTPA